MPKTRKDKLDAILRSPYALSSPMLEGLRSGANLSSSLPVTTDADTELTSLAYTGATSFRKNLGLEPTDAPTFAGLTVGGDTDKAVIGPTGFVQLFGAATAWDDLRITPGSFDRPGVSDPAYVAYAPNGGGLSVYLPEFAKDDFASFSVQLPHSYKHGTDISVHVHWTPGARGNEENAALVGWKVDYAWANINGTFPDMQTADLSDACDGTDHKHQMTPEATIDGHTAAKTMSSMLVCNIRRSDTGTDDTWASTTSGQLPLLLEVDFHFEMDTLGSETASGKTA